MRSRFLLITFAVSFLIACGGGTTNKQLSPPSLTLLNSEPSSGEVQVPVLFASIQISVEEALNPDSVNGNTVTLKLAEVEISNKPDTPTHFIASPINLTEQTNTIEGNIWFDAASKTIHFEPKTQLQYGKTYVIDVRNVLLLDNRSVNIEEPNGDVTVPNIEIAFTTAHSHRILKTRYSNTGVETAFYTYSIVNNTLVNSKIFDNSKNLLTTTEYGQIFPNSNFLSDATISKDSTGEILKYSASLTENGEIVAHVTAKNSGEDMLWGTSDDLYSSFSDHIHNNFNYEITKNYRTLAFGDNALWLGLDSLDLKLSFVTLSERQGLNSQNRLVWYSSLGPNNEIDIDPVSQNISIIDDEVLLWYKKDYQEGRLIRNWRIKGTNNGEGADQILFTDDDIASVLTTYEYYPAEHRLAGLIYREFNYWNSTFEAPQPDWLIDASNNQVAANVPLQTYVIYLYDTVGNKIEVQTYSSGEDGLGETNDDYMKENSIFSTQPTITGNLPRIF